MYLFLLVRYPPLSSEVSLVASGNRVTREDRELENMDLQFPYPCTAHHNSEGMGEIYRRKNEDREEGQQSVTDPQRFYADLICIRFNFCADPEPRLRVLNSTS